MNTLLGKISDIDNKKTREKKKSLLNCKKILRNSYNDLQPGSVMVYSTCMLNLQKNEQIIV